MTGTFTRTRSKLFLHRNRSGQARSDPCPRQEHLAALHQSRSVTRKRPSKEDDDDHDDDVLLKDLSKKTKLNREASTREDDDEIPRVQNLLTKDLRARRVYSPRTSSAASPDMIENAFPKKSDVDSDIRDPKVADLGFASMSRVGHGDKLGEKFYSDGQGNDELNSVLPLVLNEYRSDGDSDMYVDDATESRESGLCCKPRNSDQGNAELFNASSDLQDCKISDKVSSEIDDLNEELVMSTPMDAEIHSEPEVMGHERKRVEDIPDKDNGKGNDSVHERKLVQKPRFQGKLFKAPGSMSYKRLSAYLMNITGDEPGKHKLGNYQNREKFMVGQEPRLPLSFPSQEVSKHELKTDSCTLRDTSKSGDLEVDAALTHVNGSKLTSSHYLLDSPMQFHTKEVTNGCLSAPYTKNKCLGESKTDLAADLLCVKDVGNALHNDESVLTTPPDAEILDKSVINAGQLESTPQDAYDVKSINLTRSSEENPGAAFCHKRKDSVLKSKSVSRSNLHRKLFKTSGSVSYRRMLPFLVDSGIEDSGTSKLGSQTPSKTEGNMSAQRYQLPLSTQSQEASIDDHNTENSSMHDTVESNALVNKIIVAPADELPLDNQPKLTSSGDLPDLSMPLDAKEPVHEFSSAPSINKHVEEGVNGSKHKRSSDSKFDSCSVTMDLHFEKNDRQHNSESPPKAPNLLYINGDVSNLVLEHHSSKETELPIDYDDGKHLECLEKHEPFSRCPCEGQSVNHLDLNMLDSEDNETSSQTIFRSDDEVLNHVSVSNEEPRAPEKVIVEKSDMVGIDGDKAGTVLKGIVNGSMMPSKGSNNKNAKYIRDIGNGSESKTIWALNGCSRKKLMKHAGSINYERLLPFVLNTMKDNSCDLVSDHGLKLQKCLDQSPLLPKVTSDLNATPVSDLNGSAPMERSSSISQIPESNGPSKLGSSRDPPISNQSDSSLYSEVKGNSSFQISYNVGKPPEIYEQPRFSDDGCRRGILKRNPRGCRGLCSCLNCVSFRLHAERAFEFSRNQLLDADEVAQILIKELSHLRNILERSTERENDNPGFNGRQVKEACMKAFETEQLAKDRLSQMNDDLQIHCKITSLERPRVRFADRVEERVIQPDR